MSQFDNVSVVKKANVYFDGKCVSHTVLLADGTKKTVGVILPSTPDLQHRRAGNHGRRRRFLPRQAQGRERLEDLRRGQSFDVPGNSSLRDRL